VGHCFVVPIRLSCAFGWLPQLSLSSLRGDGHIATSLASVIGAPSGRLISASL
jgi:hypothetical protein